MNLTYDDFKKGQRLYRGIFDEYFYFDGKHIFKLKSGDFFVRVDYHILPVVGFFPVVELYKINKSLVSIYLANHYYTYILTQLPL